MTAVRSHLATYGIEFTSDLPEFTTDPGTWKGTLSSADRSALIRVVLLSPMTLTALARTGLDEQHLHSPRLPTLLVGRSVHEKSAGGFRDMGLMFADTVGNAYLRFPGVLVDVRGRRAPHLDEPPDGPRPAGPNPASTNLFSAGRAQLVAALIAWPDLATGPVRETAAAAGISTGQAHSALALLEQTGYLVERRVRSDRVEELLDLWTAAYPRGLGPKLAVASYTATRDIGSTRDDILHEPRTDHRTDVDVDAGADEGPELELSGESVPGIGIREPLSLTVYARAWTPRRAVRHRWRAARSAAEADVHVRRRFWTAPSGPGEGKTAPVAPWPIVYADLVATGDPRLAEVAAEWRSRHRDR